MSLTGYSTASLPQLFTGEVVLEQKVFTRNRGHILIILSPFILSPPLPLPLCVWAAYGASGQQRCGRGIPPLQRRLCCRRATVRVGHVVEERVLQGPRSGDAARGEVLQATGQQVQQVGGGWSWVAD